MENISDSEHPLTVDLINKTREELESIGCAVIPGFIRSESLLRKNAEAEKKLDEIQWTSDRNNPYFTKDDPELPEDHQNDFSWNVKAGTSLQTTWTLIPIFIQFFNPWN